MDLRKRKVTRIKRTRGWQGKLRGTKPTGVDVKVLLGGA